MSFSEIVPYGCVYLDCCWRDLLHAAYECTVGSSNRESVSRDICQLWTSASDPRPVLPCLSVRTALDLYLTIQAFPRGSEIIVSAINIPDMIEILHHHGLRVVSLDVSMDTVAPKIDWLEDVISDKTVAILLAHIYGKLFDMEPFVKIAQKHNLPIIEDCAEAFSGFNYLGHPGAELSLFSFGAIKYYTAFGGAVAKIGNIPLYEKIQALYSTYPTQTQSSYLYKVLKYSFLYIFLNCPKVMHSGMYLTKTLGINHKTYVVSFLRGFPKGLVDKVRQQPSTALLGQLLYRFKGFSSADFSISVTKGKYVARRLPSEATAVGDKADVNNYWLFPIVVEDPEEVVKALNILGIDAYRGATQLSLIEPDNGQDHLHHLHTFVTRYPHEAQYMMDHIVYLPINRLVPFQDLDRICAVLDTAIKSSGKHSVMNPKRGLKINSKL